MLAAAGVEGRVASPEGRALVFEWLIANFTSGTRAGQSSARSPAKEGSTLEMTMLTRSACVVMV